MDKSPNKEIGSLEFFSLLAYMISMQATDLTPNLLMEDGKNAIWMIPLFTTIFMAILFLILSSVLKKFESKSIIEINYILTGKYFGFVINLVFILIMFLASVSNTRNYIDIIEIMVLPNTPRWAIYLPLMFVVYYIANKGIEVMARTAWIFFPILLVILLIHLFLSLNEVNIAYLFPFWGPGIDKLLVSSLQHIPLVGDVVLITAFSPYIRNHKELKRSALAGLLFSGVGMMVFFAIYIGVFDYPSSANILYPFHQLSSIIGKGKYVFNLESFFFAFWVIASAIRFSVYLQLTVVMFAQTFCIKEFKPLTLTFATFTLLLGMLPENAKEAAYVYRQSILHNYTWLIMLILPILLWVLSKIRKNKAKWGDSSK